MWQHMFSMPVMLTVWRRELDCCIWTASQQSMCFPLRHGLSNCSVFSFVPYSCPFSRICAVYADVELLDLIYLMCSLNLVTKKYNNSSLEISFLCFSCMCEEYLSQMSSMT